MDMYAVPFGACIWIGVFNGGFMAISMAGLCVVHKVLESEVHACEPEY